MANSLSLVRVVRSQSLGYVRSKRGVDRNKRMLSSLSLDEIRNRNNENRNRIIMPFSSPLLFRYNCYSMVLDNTHTWSRIHSGERYSDFSYRFFSSGVTDEKQNINKTATSSSNPGIIKASPEKSYLAKAQDLTKAGIQVIINFIIKTPGVLWYFLTHPKELKAKLIEFKELAKKEAHHYYMGSKLLVADIRTARAILLRTLNGSHLSRRERKQLVRTVSDVFRLVPMSVFVLVPFMEFLLPFALKIFPNMLPSTFQDSLKAEENMKRELQSRIAMAGFLQETLQSLVKKKKGIDASTEKSDSATDFLQFLESARKGEILPPEAIIKFSSYFKDEFTLENFPRAQLVNLCRYMSIPPYGSDSLLRFQLRHKIRSLKEDDQRIIFEGVQTLTKMELREACQERGMRSTGLSKEGYRDQLEQWLELSVVKDVPIALLVISRTYMLREDYGPSRSTDEPKDKAIANLADAISGLDKDVLNEVVLEVATEEEKRRNPDVLKIKLEVLKQQNELIAEEIEAKLKTKQMAEGAKAVEEAKDDASEEKIAILEEKAEKATIESKKEVAEKIEPPPTSDTQPTSLVKADDGIEDKVSTVDKEPSEGDSEEKSKDIEAEEEEEEETELSPEELDAIKQLISPDSLTSERAELQKIKAAMQEELVEESNETESDKVITHGASDFVESDSTGGLSVEDIKEPTSGVTKQVEDIDEIVASKIKQSEQKVEDEAEATTTITMGVEQSKTLDQVADDEEEEEESDKKLEKTVTSLKSKVEKMVAKIEKEMEQTSMKIGDRMHLLDLDQDGILSKEEVAACLQTVLKRKLTLEEAMAIASDMDTDEDGLFTVAEFNKWVDGNKLVKLVEEGREDEVDEVIVAKVEGENEADEQKSNEIVSK